jgi:TolA-binding protein
VEKKPEPVVTPPPKKEPVPPVMAQAPKAPSAQDKKTGSPTKTIAITLVAVMVLALGGVGLIRYLRTSVQTHVPSTTSVPPITQQTPQATPPPTPPVSAPVSPPVIPPVSPPAPTAKSQPDDLVLQAKNQIKSNPANARKLLDRALAMSPDHFEANYQLARLLTFQKDFQNAIPAYQKAQQLNKKLPEIPFNLGFIYMSQGDFDQAIVYYEQCRNLRPAFLDEVLTNLGFCYLQKNNKKMARTLFTEAVKVNPKNRIARNYLKNNGDQP